MYYGVTVISNCLTTSLLSYALIFAATKLAL